MLSCRSSGGIVSALSISVRVHCTQSVGLFLPAAPHLHHSQSKDCLFMAGFSLGTAPARKGAHPSKGLKNDLSKSSWSPQVRGWAVPCAVLAVPGVGLGCAWCGLCCAWSGAGLCPVWSWLCPVWSLPYLVQSWPCPVRSLLFLVWVVPARSYCPMRIPEFNSGPGLTSKFNN